MKPLALVTGSPGIIGPAICGVLKRDGWRVAACSASASDFKLYEKAFGKPVPADAQFYMRFTGRESCHRLARQVRHRLGLVKLLVNNAGDNPAKGVPLRELREKHLAVTLHANFSAALWLSQALEEDLLHVKGSIINISSVMAVKHVSSNFLYPAMKAALETLTATLAIELGPHGVRVNAIRVGSVPGYAFMRDTIARMPASKARAFCHDILKEYREKDTHVSALPRSGVPMDIAEMVAFLASPKAGFVNGSVVPVEGGFTTQWNRVSSWDSGKAIDRWLKKHRVALKR